MRYLGFYSMYSFWLLCNMITLSYNFNRYSTSALSFRLCLSFFSNLLLIHLVECYTANLLLLWYFLLPRINFVLVDYYSKIIMTNISIYRCLRYYFFYAIQFESGPKINLFMPIFFPCHCFQNYFVDPITDKKH